MILLIYIIKTVLISGLLFCYYWLFLRNRAFHQFNRLFLLSIPFISFLLPALHLNMPSFWNQHSAGLPIRLLGVGPGSFEEAVTIYGNKTHGNMIPLQSLLILLSLGFSLFLFFRFVKTIHMLIRLRKNKPFLKLPEATIYFVSEKGTPFSFFNSIFWGNEMDLNGDAGKQILRHELFHVKQNHSMDMVIMEMVSIVIWFNPFHHLIHKELKAIHEYGADAYVAAVSDSYAYASLLLLNTPGSPIPITNPFFKNQIKRRITMMTKSPKNSKGLLGRFMILPLILILLGMFSFKLRNPVYLHSNKTIRVVIDAGHGGVDAGTIKNGITEKNINLLIAKKIQEMSGEYNIEVVMTRENDELSGKGENISHSLKYRTDLAEKENASLFISIHTNSTAGNMEQEKYSGFDIYIPSIENKVHEGSVKLASIITDYIKPDYKIASELKERKGVIQVLDNATVPSILIECGYMDNNSDLAYLQDEKNQEKIARDILEGIRKYAAQSSTYMKSDSSRHAEMNHPDTANPNHLVFTKVEVEAEYPGGQQAWYSYLQKNLDYPQAAVNKEIQGQVLVKFIVKKTGAVTNIHAVSGPKELRDVSVNVIKGSGKWIPAKQNGLIVESWHLQPINYKLEAQ